jgi:murein L,D-transpeptidase YafK
MTDALIEEIYAIARESFLGANDSFQVHAFPFRMTPQNMARHANYEAYSFWMTLKEGYDYFELTRQVPTIAVCNHRYMVNVAWPGGEMSRLDPEGACPAFFRPRPDPFRPKPGEEQAEQRVIVPGHKTRDVASIENAQRSGVTNGASSFGFARDGSSAMSFAPNH